MKNKDEQPMFDLDSSQVDKLNDNETESGTLVKAKDSKFGEMVGNQRGSKRESTKSKLRWEFLKSPITITTGIVTTVVAAVILSIIEL